MKSKTIAAVIIAAALIVFIFVRLFNTKPPQAFSIIGKWKLDTAYAAIPVTDSIQKLIGSVVGNGEKSKTWFKFNADSSFSRLSTKDSTSEKYYTTDAVLYLNEGYGYIPYPFKSKGDSLVEFINKDSVVFVLKKQ